MLLASKSVCVWNYSFLDAFEATAPNDKRAIASTYPVKTILRRRLIRASCNAHAGDGLARQNETHHSKIDGNDVMMRLWREIELYFLSWWIFFPCVGCLFLRTGTHRNLKACSIHQLNDVVIEKIPSFDTVSSTDRWFEIWINLMAK